MKNKFLTTCLTALVIPSLGFGEELNEVFDELDDLNQRLYKVERDSILDKVSVGLEVRARIDYIDRSDVITPAGVVDLTSDDLITTRLRLNMFSRITEDLQVRSRVTYLGFSGTSDFENNPDPLRVPDGDDDFTVEYAYFDYFIPNSPFAVSGGRSPFTDGPPNELKNNTERRATYNYFTINQPLDAILLTTDLGSIGLEGFTHRIGYQKFFSSSGAADEIGDSNVIITALEGQIPGVEKSLMWFSYAFAEIPSQPIPGSVPSGNSNANFVNFLVQANDINESGFDAFFTIDYSTVDSDGTNTFPAGTVAPVDLSVSFFSDSASGNLGSSNDGLGIFSGFRYTPNLDSLGGARFGFEFTHRDDTHLTFGRELTLFNKFDVRGQTYEAYWIQPFSRHMFTRLGVVLSEASDGSAFGTLGTPQSSDESGLNLYFLVDVST